jgi:formylglycine-generating enzyme required for sulfatase activity
MVVVQPGSFTMGAPAGEEARANLPEPLRGRASPQHLITIGHAFALAKFDVTRDEYAQFVAETNRPDPDSCITANASGTGFIATNGKCRPDPYSCITVNASGTGFIVTNGNWHSPGFPQTGTDPVACVSTRRGRERRRRVTVAMMRRSSAATPMLLIWILVSSFTLIARRI